MCREREKYSSLGFGWDGREGEVRHGGGWKEGGKVDGMDWVGGVKVQSGCVRGRQVVGGKRRGVRKVGRAEVGRDRREEGRG